MRTANEVLGDGLELFMRLPTHGTPEMQQRALDLMVEALARAWDEGHVTDTHGPHDCECENPYRTLLRNRT